MDEIHLDPACDFVSVKSAESDGVNSEVAFRHYKECTQCRKYHMMTVQKADLFGTTIQKTMDELDREEREQEARKTESINDNQARLELVISYLGGTVEKVMVDFPFKHTETVTEDGAKGELKPCVRSIVRIDTDVGPFEICVTAGVGKFELWRTKGRRESATYETAPETIAGLAMAIAKARHSQKGKKQK